MNKFTEIELKGISQSWIVDTLDPDRLHLHITEVPAGARPHSAHAHEGAEAFYVLEGSGEVEMEGETVPVATNQVVILDATRMHGLVNTGSTPMKYIVIIAKQQ
jgi:mannose-6-phosphate isomerase-like protein (cupin superfamily)